MNKVREEMITNFEREKNEKLEALKDFSYPVVVKADGLAAGKGVVIAYTEEEAKDATETRKKRAFLIEDEEPVGVSGEELLPPEEITR